jgi:hypothetical protein
VKTFEKTFPNIITADKNRINYIIQRLINVGISRSCSGLNKKTVKVKFKILKNEDFINEYEDDVIDLTEHVDFKKDDETETQKYLVCDVIDEGEFLNSQTIKKILKPPSYSNSSEIEHFNLSNIKKISVELNAKLLINSFPMDKTTFSFIIPV